MKIIAHTTTPPKLLTSIKSEINKGNLKTWGIVKVGDEVFFNHTPEQWDNKALIGSSLLENKLELEIRWWESKVPSEDIKGYILGRFTEILMVHFRDYFEVLEVR